MTAIFGNAFEKLIERAHLDPAPEDYRDESGILHCGKCGGEKEALISFPGIGERRVTITCACKEAEYQETVAAMRRARVQHHIDELRDRGLTEAGYLKARFEADKGYNPAEIAFAKRYVERWEDVKRKNIGLLYTGGVGTGKSFIACCIANALIDKGVPVLVASLPKLISASGVYDLSEVLADVESADLLVLDDVGVERDTSYSTERVFEIIDTRINSDKPIIVTTNLSPAELKSGDIDKRRIYNRICGACVLRRLDGANLRRDMYKAKEEDLRDILGI